MRFLSLIVALLVAGSGIHAQTSTPFRVDQPLLVTGPNVPSSGVALPQALWLANASVSICQHPATLSACVPVTTYSDSTEATTCPTSAQMTLTPASICTSQAGAAARVGFWYDGGIVDYIVSSPYGTFGPFTITTAVISGAGGSPTQVQFNCGSQLCGDPDFTTDGAGNVTATTVTAKNLAALVPDVVTLKNFTTAKAAALGSVTLVSYLTGTGLGGGTFNWVAGSSNSNDGCNNITLNSDTSGAIGVWQRAGGTYQPIIPENCGALGGGMVDDCTALTRAYTLLSSISLAAASAPPPLNIPVASIIFNPKIYKTSCTLALPGGTAANGGSGGDNWTIDSYGKTTILQSTDNIPIMRQRSPAGATTRNYQINNFIWGYINNQPFANKDAIAIMYDPQGNVPNGTLNFTLNHNKFLNCFRGVSISTEAVAAGYTFPIFGWGIYDVYSLNTMSGADIDIGGFGASGSTRGILQNYYAQAASPLGTGRGEATLIIQQMDLLTAISLETNIGFNLQYSFTGVTELEGTNWRFEKDTQTFGGSHLVTISSVIVGSIHGLKFEHMVNTSAANTSVDYIHLFEASLWLWDVHAENDDNPTGSVNGALNYLVFAEGTPTAGRATFGNTPYLPGAATTGVAISTSAAQGSPSTTLTFASTTGVANGQSVNGPSITAGTTVASFTSTTVTMSALSTGIVASGARISFSDCSTLCVTYVAKTGPPNTLTPNIEYSNGETLPQFGLTSVAASLSNSPMSTAGGVGSFRAQKSGYVVKVSLASTQPLTAGTATALVAVNGTNFFSGILPQLTTTSLPSASYTFRTANPVADLNLIGAAPFNAGDIITANITTSSDMLPAGAGQNATVQIYVAYN